LGNPEKIAKLLYCASLLEEKTYQLYYQFSQKIEDPIAGPKMLFIAQDSLKHSTLFKDVSKSIMNTKLKEKECKKGLGETWNHIIEVTELINKKKSFSTADLLKLLNKLTFIEFTIGEEYSILVKLKTLRSMKQMISNSYGVDLGSVENILEAIIKDEKYHREILVDMFDHLTEQKLKTDNTPKVKYQNPDAWIFPPNK